MTLMEGARNAGIDAIAADCGGACACATCHVYIADDWGNKVGPRSEMEADMLEFAAAETNDASRLSCQITLTAHHDGLQVRTPANARVIQCQLGVCCGARNDYINRGLEMISFKKRHQLQKILRSKTGSLNWI